MDKNMKKILKNNTKKRSIPIALFGEERWYGIRIALMMSPFVVGLAIFDFVYLWSFVEDMFFRIAFSGITLLLETAILLTLFLLIGVLIHIFTISVPVLLNRRYLPLTKDEIAALNMNESEFYDFIMKVSGKYSRFDKRWFFVDMMYEDVSVMLNIYNEIHNKTEGYIWGDCHEEFKEWLSNHQYAN
ncbi:MAG: hypothetical protein IJZ27_04265 [Treponema sp.]|nr:hypothetical protein [Treponema sp.]